MKRFVRGQQVTAGQQAAPEFAEYLAGLERAILALEGKMAAIAAVVAPSGGATTDAEARDAIAAIIAGAE